MSQVQLRSDHAGAGLEPAPRDGLRAITLPAEWVERGDVVAVGRRFYGVDSVVRGDARFEFLLIVLRNLETGARAAIEFRNPDVPLSVLRVEVMPWLETETETGAGRRAPFGARRLRGRFVDRSGSHTRPAGHPAAGTDLKKGPE